MSVTEANIALLSPCSCFEDDEPPCVEQIEYSADCPAPNGADLDSDVNANATAADEQEDNDGHGEAKVCSGGVGRALQSSARGRLFPPAM